METLWGFTRGERIYIVAFMPFDHTGRPFSCLYVEAELDEHEDQAKEERLQLLGTIHSHPNCVGAVMSSGDIIDGQDTQEIIQAICAISWRGDRRLTAINYWPNVRPLRVSYR